MNDKPLQLILVVETSGIDKSDTIYINSVLERYYDTEGVNISWELLSGKQNYNNKKLLRKITNNCKAFSNIGGVSVVIYFVDTDSTETEYKNGSFFSNLQKLIDERGYQLVWFCKNTENVFLGVEPETLTNKTKAAIEFERSRRIESIKVDMLSKEKIQLYCSNIMLILDKYLKRKE